MSATGHLYAFGSNGSGQLGLEHREDVSAPTRCLVPDLQSSDIPVKIVAGGNHTLVLFQSGAIYAAGENKDGRTCTSQQIGFGRVQFPSPDETLIDRFTSCSATWEASMFVHLGTTIYSCGTGHKGELGHSEGCTVINEPRQILHFPPLGMEIVNIASSMWHTVAVLSSGEVYGWGQGRKGQLGKPAGAIWIPRRFCDLPFPAKRVCCGREFTYIVGEPGSGHHMIFGSDKWDVQTAVPDFGALPSWTDIGANWGSIHVLLRDHSLLSWGRNDHGQLAPAGLPPIRCIAAGSEHVLALTTNHILIAWGWGEHGNCGQDIDETGDVKRRWNQIALPADVSTSPTESALSIGAGCASSWVWYQT